MNLYASYNLSHCAQSSRSLFGTHIKSVDTVYGMSADLIQAGTRGSIAGGVVIFVIFCLGFLSTGLWIVYTNVHRNDSRKAHWVVPNVEEEEVRQEPAAVDVIKSEDGTVHAFQQMERRLADHASS